MNELTKDDYFEIEKVMDSYAGNVNAVINKYCDTAINMSAVREYTDDNPNPMDDQINAMIKTRERIKEIRDKLMEMRNK